MPAAPRQPPPIAGPPRPQWFTAGADELKIHGNDPSKLLAKYGSPLHVVDMAALDRNAATALAPYREAGRGADVFSSYKTNPIPGVLGRLHDAGIGAEVISEYEFWLALELGVPPARVIYNGPAKSFESLRRAAELKVALVNANSLGDLRQIIAASKSVGTPTRTGVRISLPHMWGGQFGLPADSRDVAQCVHEGMNSPHVELVGLHFHSGFGLQDHHAFRAHMTSLLEFCDDARTQTGFHPEVIDLGGSLTVPSVVTNQPSGRIETFAQRMLGRFAPSRPKRTDVITVAQASSLAWRLADLHFAAAGLDVPDLMLEPGRSLTGDTQLMLTTALEVREGVHESDPRTVILDAGVELAEPMRGGGHDIVNTTRPDATLCHHRLVGPRADTGDLLVDDAIAPHIETGDVIAVLDTGAYFVPFSIASTYPRPAIVALDGGSVIMLRDRERQARFTELDPD